MVFAVNNAILLLLPIPFSFYIHHLLLSSCQHLHSIMQIHFTLCDGSGLSFCILYSQMDPFFVLFFMWCCVYFFSLSFVRMFVFRLWSTTQRTCSCLDTISLAIHILEQMKFFTLVSFSFLFDFSLSFLVFCCFESQRYHLTFSQSCAVSILFDFLAVSFHLSRVFCFVCFFSSHLFFVQER